jgi:rhodanese-related sulfurtransferase
MRKQRITISGIVLFSLILVCTNAFAGWKKVTTAEVEAIVAQKPEQGGYMIVDSRPEIKFFASHLPWAVSIPWQDMKDMLDELPTDKSTKLIFYCGGLKCKLSHKAADLAIAQGYSDVSVYAEGEPGWKQAGQTPWVAVNHIKILLNDPEKIALVVDSRPTLKYNNGTVPGAMNIPWPQFDKMKGLLPADKATQLIFFCGGLKCNLSHKSADAAKALGYTDVRVFAEGYPKWKKKSKRAFAMVDPKNPGAAAAPAEKITYPGEIKKDEFLKLVKTMPEGFMLVDVRPAEDFKAGNIPGSINILDEEVKNNIDTLKGAKNIVFACATGSRSAIAYYAAEEAGLKGTHFLNAEISYNADGTYEVN